MTEFELFYDIERHVSVDQLRQKYNPEFVRNVKNVFKFYDPAFSVIVAKWCIPYLTWLFDECHVDVMFRIRVDGPFFGWKTSILDYVIWNSSGTCLDKDEVIKFLLQRNAPSNMGFTRILQFYMISCPFPPVLAPLLLDRGAKMDDLTPGELALVTPLLESRRCARAGCIALLSLHQKWPHGAWMRQCWPREMLGAVARAVWAQRWNY